MMGILRRYWWIVAGLVLVVAVVVVAVWPRGGPPPRSRQYLAFSACLLTGAQGLADPQTGAVWAGMQDASLATRAKVSYLPVASPGTEADVLPYATALIQRHCDVIVAVGASEVAAVRQGAAQHPSIRFVLVGGANGGGNVSVVPGGPAAQVRSAVAGIIQHAVVS